MTQTVSVTLPGAALYVSGTVNGVETVWTNTEGYTWHTTAPRAADDTYVVELTIINASGISTQAALTLYYGVLTLITDRTAADKRKAEQLNAKGLAAMTAEEKTYYLSAANKGTYKALDMNRVGAAVEYIADRAHTAGINVEVYPKTDWLDSDIPTPAQLARYLRDVAELRAAIAQLPSTPRVIADITGLTIEAANDLEQILLDLDNAFNRLPMSLWHSGEINCGEV